MSTSPKARTKVSTPRSPSTKPPPRRRQTQAERREATQDKLVKGAIQLLKEKRYAGFRTAEVSAVAGVSRGAQTHHFATKDDLVVLALEHVYLETSARSRRRIATAGPTREGLIKALVDDSAEFFLGEDFLLSLDLVMVGGEGGLRAAVRKLAQQYRLALEEEWRQAFLAAGCSEQDAHDIIWITFAVGRGLGVRKVMSGNAERLRDVLERWGAMAVAWLPDEVGAAAARKRGSRRIRS